MRSHSLHSETAVQNAVSVYLTGKPAEGQHVAEQKRKQRTSQLPLTAPMTAPNPMPDFAALSTRSHAGTFCFCTRGACQFAATAHTIPETQ